MIPFKVYLKANREKSILKHHPWIFSGAIQKIPGNIQPGSIAAIYSSTGNFLAWASINPKSQITARILSWDEVEEINEAFIHKKIFSAVEKRKGKISSEESDSYRCFYAESDGIPGLIIDIYHDQLVVQISSAGAEYWRTTIIEACQKITGVAGCFERSDEDIRELEGLAPSKGVLFGNNNNFVEIEEWGIHYLVDVQKGQKTGFYLDQRQNRRKLREYSKNKSVLNCFSYTGGFTLNALAGECAEVISIESSKDAISLAKRNIELNSLPNGRDSWIEGDVFLELRKFRDSGRKFDLIVLDPPKFAPTYNSIPKATRAYKDINLLAFKLLEAGGTLFTFSCSGGISSDLFQKIVHGAALDAKREVTILERLHQDIDHPVPLSFPEAEYLKGLVCSIQE
jgi:23S rRNA (cytosine1962-C5)-methyltransferase